MVVAGGKMTSHLKMKHMGLLVAISDCGTLLKAAERVAISQPGATKALQEIERVFGQQLFDRTNRGLEPNELGLCAIRYARLISTDMMNLGREIEQISKGSGGHLSIGAIMGAVPFSSSLIASFVEASPNLKVQFSEGTSLELLQMLDEGRLDFAICRISVSARPEEYMATELRRERLCIVANRRHPLALSSEIQLEELRSFPWIVCLPDMPMRRHFEREFANRSIPTPKSLIETASALSLLRLMRENHYLCSMQAKDVVEELIGCGELCQLPVQLTSTSEPYYLVYRRDRELSPTARNAIESIQGIP